MLASYSLRLVDPDDVDLVERLRSRLGGGTPRVVAVHDGFGTLSFFSAAPRAVLRDRVREAIDAEVGETGWGAHFRMADGS